MRQIIPFTKEITFKTKIGELTSISLDNDLQLKGEDLITGNFYIKGTYKMLATSEIEETYSYKIPCEIAISDDYDTFDATVDIDNFLYEIINEEILKVNIDVLIDNLEKKEIVVEEPKEEEVEEKEIEEVRFEYEPVKVNDNELLSDNEILNDNNINNNEVQIFNTVFDTSEDTYLTYNVYIIRDNDTIESILEKYNVTKEELSKYNDLTDIFPGMKIIVPSFLNNE